MEITASVGAEADVDLSDGWSLADEGLVVEASVEVDGVCDGGCDATFFGRLAGTPPSLSPKT